MMSANNWRSCPKCCREYNKSKEYLDSVYGNIPLEDYNKLISKLPENPKSEQNLREDYEIGINVNGSFFLSYRGSCDRCGFEYKYSHKENVLERE